MKINYSTSINIWLHLEDYYNAGMSPEKAREVIESIVDPSQRGGYSSASKLRCSPMGLNGNWIVKSFAMTDYEIENIVSTIEWHLDQELFVLQVAEKVNRPTAT